MAGLRGGSGGMLLAVGYRRLTDGGMNTLAAHSWFWLPTRGLVSRDSYEIRQTVRLRKNNDPDRCQIRK